ncbi:MAG: phosphoenolpyruvate synthase [Myxococcales bacterium]|nr:phosphoenolpyruvate synthase [Myxococcales bacterium]
MSESPVLLGTKAETLERIAPRLRHACVLPQLRFTVREWRDDRAGCLGRVRSAGWLSRALIVRSSAVSEDGADTSLAGHYRSIPDVLGADAFERAVDDVVASYGGGDDADQVLVQPMLSDVLMSGVAFSVDPSTGGPYVVINYDAVSTSTSSVTSGTTNLLETRVHYKQGPVRAPAPLDRVVDLVAELEALTGIPWLDVEFAETRNDGLVLLQVRRLHGVAPTTAPEAAQRKALSDIAHRVGQLVRPHPWLHGSRTVFGVMPDWNPAEIVGVRPRPLALSLYRELITDSIWAYQRDNYGYKNLRSFPLLLSFSGLPYIDVRVSFNSFIPRDVPRDLSDRLANYYVDRLIAAPSNHDKVEFEIIYTCYTLDLPERLGVLKDAGFSAADCEQLTESLRVLTNRIIHGETGLWRQDTAKIARLEERLGALLESDLDPVGMIYWLLEDCKRYGTLPFAGLARAGFIAVQLLKSLVAVGVLSPAEYDAFMGSLDTVSSRMSNDFAALSPSAFLERYGHLRPGTYDILSPRYDEAPDRYFDWSRERPAGHRAAPRFSLSLDQLRRIDAMLRQHRLEHDILGLFEFIKAAIEGREYAKFVFTRSLSEALTRIRALGSGHGLSVEDCSFLDVHAIYELYGSSSDPREVLERSVAAGRAAYALTRQISLPPLITSPDDVWSFSPPASDPNFITQRSAAGPVVRAASDEDGATLSARLAGAVLLIPSADPGYDWIFSHGIVAFITMYGGVNSHMAIRAGELGIPAVIGAGESLFQRWSTAEILELDCANRQVRVVR